MASDKSDESNAGRLPPHSSIGASLVMSMTDIDIWTRLLQAIPIEGHHGGVRDCCAEPENDETATFFAYIERADTRRRFEAAMADPHPDLLKQIAYFERMRSAVYPHERNFALDVRMSLGVLVDQDRLDAASSSRRQQTSSPSNERTGIVGGLDRFEDALERSDARRGPSREYHDDRPLQRNRSKLRQDCTQAASLAPGLFRCSAPVGLGKTLSVMRFALRHAAEHGLERVIWATPHVAVTSQVAGVLRGMLGEEMVLEHHSGAIDHHPAGTRKMMRAGERMRLILRKENWQGAPVIVTTIHQLFESLMSAEPKKLRKIGAIPKAVIVIDEAQGLPTNLMQQIVTDLRALMRFYRTSVVLATATQPPLKSMAWKKFEGLEDAREIVSDPLRMFEETRRVRTRLHRDLEPVAFRNAASLNSFADTLARHESVLCIVNEVDQARRLHKAMPRGTFHLSARMCVAHRNEVLAQVKARLVAEEPVRLISTSLIEAGVDIDFPVVYRALAGLDQIAQAAGRCNREWTREFGDFVVFDSIDFEFADRATVKRNTGKVIRRVLKAGTAGLDDLFAPREFERYFSLRDMSANLDASGVWSRLNDRTKFPFPNFRTASRKARIICEETVSVITPWGPDKEYLRQVLDPISPGDPAAEVNVFSLIQGQTVSLRANVHERFVEARAV